MFDELKRPCKKFTGMVVQHLILSVNRAEMSTRRMSMLSFKLLLNLLLAAADMRDDEVLTL